VGNNGTQGETRFPKKEIKNHKILKINFGKEKCPQTKKSG
jgi:hypothetical protein